MKSKFNLKLFSISIILCLIAGIPCLAGIKETKSTRFAHPLSILEADVYVNRKLTNMRLKMFAEDLQFFQGVEPQESGYYDTEQLKQAIKDHAKYLAKRITIRDTEGELLEAELMEIIDFDIPEEGIFDGELMKYQIGYVFQFKHPVPPEFLTFQQDVVDDDFLFPAEMKMLLKQAGTETNYMAMMKAGEGETVRFDWDQPPLSTEASEKEWSEWFDEQREKTLGITSYSSVYSFIYLTDYEIRHEVLIPLASLATIVDIDRADQFFLEIAEQDAAKEKIIDVFSEGNPVTIDGIEVQPIFDRIDFYGLDLRDFAMQAERRKVSMANGRVGLILSYRTKGTPDQVSVTWDKFSQAISTVESVIFAFEKTDRTQFSTYIEDNTYAWENPGRPPLPELSTIQLNEIFLKPRIDVPVVSLIIFGSVGLLLTVGLFWQKAAKPLFALSLLGLAAGVVLYPYVRTSYDADELSFLPSSEKLPELVQHEKYKCAYVDGNAKQVFNTLHKNLFRAFDYHYEEDIYDALAKSVDGPQLRQSYLDIRKSLEVQQQGGAVSAINEVNILDGEVVTPLPEKPIAGTGFAYRCQWNLIGTVEHWGHIHKRTNEYDAIFNVEDCDGQWKITWFQVLDQKQGPVKTDMRKF